MNEKHKKLVSGQEDSVWYYSKEGKGGKPITFIANDTIKEGFEDICIEQAITSRYAPGVEELVLNPDCLTEDTEILTDSGFKLITKLKKKDLIANVDIEASSRFKKDIYFYAPKQIIVRNLKNSEHIEEYFFSSFQKKITVTNKHRMPYRPALGVKSEYLPKRSKLKDFILGGNGHQVKKGLNISDDLIRLVVWIVGDGNIKKAKNKKETSLTLRWGLKKERKIKRLYEVLDCLNLPYSITINQKQTEIRLPLKISQDLIKIVSTKKEYPLSWIKGLSKRQAILFLDEALNVDGDYTNSIKYNTYTYTSKRKKDVDFFSALIAINLGVSNAVERKNGIYSIKAIPSYNMYESNAGLHESVVLRKKIEYSGKVVCVSCDSGYFIARQKGFTFITGNCHMGYGAPIGCVMKTSKHIYPGPVGFDIKCSMSLLQTDLPKKEIEDKRIRRALINAIEERLPTGLGSRKATKAREVDKGVGYEAILAGATDFVCMKLGIPLNWKQKCEDSYHGDQIELSAHLEELKTNTNYYQQLTSKLDQLGSYGGGNHFLSGDITTIAAQEQSIADSFGLREGCLALLSHCGSRGFGYQLAKYQFQKLEDHFKKWHLPFPGGDKQLVYAPLASPEGREYLNDMYLAANFATVNHLLINALLLEAVQEVLPGTKGNLVYYISHNMAREEIIDDKKCWIHRKGATRAYPAGHFSLEGTPFFDTGHPILLPGNAIDGSVVMVALPGAKKSLYSVNHGAGRTTGRRSAKKTLDQATIDAEMEESGILTNCRNYPIDECKRVYKDFSQVLDSVESAKLAKTVAKLEPMFVIKDKGK